MWDRTGIEVLARDPELDCWFPMFASAMRYAEVVEM